MKAFAKTSVVYLALSLSLLPATAFADSRVCPKRLESDAEAKRSIDFLRSVEGRYKLGSCKVELHVCDRFAYDQTKSEIADLLITDKFGFERYVPIHIPEVETAKTTSLKLNYQRTFHYEFLDYIEDPFNGAYEKYRLEIVKTPDLKAIEYLEAGFTSRRERTSGTNKKWINCGGSANSGGMRHAPTVPIEGVFSGPQTANSK